MQLSNRNNVSFLVAAPPYNRIFAGVRVMHDLCHELNSLGYRAAMILCHSGDGITKPYEWAISNNPEHYVPGNLRFEIPAANNGHVIQDFLNNGIVIYPEIVPGNPFGAKRVIRYLLNANDTPYPNEFVCAFSARFRESPDFILPKIIAPDYMNMVDAPKWGDRTLDVTYFGKGPKFTQCHVIPNTLLIERDWPRRQEEVALILKHTRYFFSFDAVTSLSMEAFLCGAVSVLLHDDQSPKSIKNKEEFKLPKITLMDKNDAKSLLYDPALLKKETDELSHAIEYYRSTWSDRVNKFVAECKKYFKI
jgi:hypothetical protein